jgi:enolase
VIIKSVKAKLVKDSRSAYTVEATINGKSAICPSGKSKGKYEAKTTDPKSAVNVINKLEKKLKNLEFTQEEFDNLLKKSKMGANATTALSMAFCRASSKNLYGEIASLCDNSKFVIPVPMMNVINGGAHADNKLAFQEFMIMPVGASDFLQAFDICQKIYDELGKLTKQFYNSDKIGDEGGYSPPLEKIEHALNLLDEAVKLTGYEDEVRYGIDVASTQFYKRGRYEVDGKKMTSKELILFYKELIDKYNIIYLEDPFHEDDFHSFAELKKQINNRIMISGDDLITTNIERLKKAIKSNSCSAMILKVNQIGTITDALRTAKHAMENDIRVVVSHRSGESEDSFIADLAVGLGCGFIKAGAPHTSYRLAKYKRLMQIERETDAKYKKI